MSVLLRTGGPQLLLCQWLSGLKMESENKGELQHLCRTPLGGKGKCIPRAAHSWWCHVTIPAASGSPKAHFDPPASGFEP